MEKGQRSESEFQTSFISQSRLNKVYARGRKVFIERVFSLRALCVFLIAFAQPGFCNSFQQEVFTFALYLLYIWKMVRTFTDQLDHSISIPFPPQRIISLVPSQTELLADLGLGDRVVGITKFCVHSEHWLQTKTIVGGTKNFHFNEIDELRPDVIFGNKEENFEGGISRLKEKYPVWMSDIVSIEDSLSMILSVGEMTNKIAESKQLVSEIQKGFNSTGKVSGQSVLYLIWRKPWMGAGTNTFINSILDHLGFRNALEHEIRYPELTDEKIQALKPDYIFLSSEPYPFREKHIEELQAISPASKIVLVDGEMFSWYGSRLLKGISYFNTLIENLKQPRMQE